MYYQGLIQDFFFCRAGGVLAFHATRNKNGACPEFNAGSDLFLCFFFPLLFHNFFLFSPFLHAMLWKGLFSLCVYAKFFLLFWVFALQSRLM